MDNIKELIEDKNIKLTNSRKSILEVLANSSKPLCYEEIKISINMDKATFYRNITKFEDENVINSFESNDKKRYFEIKKSNHAHFICTNCSKIECIHEELNFKLVKHKIENIIIKGICPKCL
jgi:Fur family ferric uptake transcriptional regulator